MTRSLLVVVLVALLVSTLANGRYIADTKLRLKRQTGDLRTAELRAWLALARATPGCPDVACGIVDVEQRSKRQTGDLKAAAYQAWLALGRTLPPDCPEVACGVVDVEASSYKRTSSDQRIAELQALIALSNTIGHGQVNPEEIGKKKRDDTSSSIDFRRSLLAQRLLRLAAEGFVNSV